MFMWLDPLYLLFALPGLALSLAATCYTKSMFSKYSKKESSSRMTGAQAAKEMLDSAGLTNVKIEKVQGFLSDHYDPRSRTLRLSPDVYGNTSLSSIGVACHEAGHALQHAANYAPLAIRSKLVPATSFGSNAAYFFIIGGFLFQSNGLILLGAALFSLAVLFSIVTLPVEWNATSRAKQAVLQSGILTPHEQKDAGRVLNAAFMTYVASAVSSALILLYFLLRAGVLGDD